MKTLLATAVALAVNLVLFALMEQMVSARVPGFEEDALETLSLDFVKLPETWRAPDRATPEPDELAAREEPLLAAPQLRVAALRATAAPTLAAVGVPAPTFEIKGRPSLGDFAVEPPSLEPLQPTVRVNPEYPRRALARKIEGTVVVAYTILRDGSTAELEIVTADPDGVFDRSALEAVRRWRFEPRSEPRRDRTTFEFELADE